MPATRNIPAEQQAAQTFADKFGRAPNSPQDLALVAKYAYPQMNDLPDELKNDTILSLYQSGVSDPAQTAPAQAGNPGSQTLDQREQANVDALQKGVGAAAEAQGAAAGTLQGSSPTALTGAFQGIQRALKAKMGTENASIGPSDLFQGAGLNSFATLHQALQQKVQDLNGQRLDLQNVLGEIGDQYKTAYTSALNNYTIAHAAYTDAVSRADTALKDLTDHQRALELIQTKNEADKELEAYKTKLANETVSNGTGDISSYLDTSAAGNSFLNLGKLEGLTPKEKAAVVTAAHAAGTPVLTASQGDTINDINVARDNIASISTFINGKLPSTWYDLPKIIGNEISAHVTQGEMASFDAYRSAATEAIRALAGPKGLRINAAEIQNFMDKNLPKITDTAANAQRKVDATTKQLDAWEKSLTGMDMTAQNVPLVHNAQEAAAAAVGTTFKLPSGKIVVKTGENTYEDAQ